MDIHHYHPDTGEYLGRSTARPSPRESGKFLIPAHATTEAPPAAGAGEIAVRADGAWTLAEDHRGETVYDTATGAAQEIDKLGPRPAGTTTKEPPDREYAWSGGRDAWLLPVAVSARRRTAEAKAELDAKLAQGWTDANGVTWPLAATDQMNVVAVNTRVAQGRGLPQGGATLAKSDQTGADHALDAAGWADLGVGMSDRIAALINAYKAHAAAIAMVATDAKLGDDEKRAALAAYDTAAGWPQ